MAHRKSPEPTNFATSLARPRPAAPRRQPDRVFKIPPEHLARIHEARAQIRRGEIVDEAELDALLAADDPE